MDKHSGISDEQLVKLVIDTKPFVELQIDLKVEEYKEEYKITPTLYIHEIICLN
jgi:hypothetical protein